MPNYKKGKGTLQLVETYEATGAESSHEFTLSSADDFTKTSYYEIIVDGVATAAFTLEMQVNQRTTSLYYLDGSRISAAAETLLDSDAADHFPIGSITLIPGADDHFNTVVKLSTTKGSAGNDRLTILFQTYGGGTIFEHGGGMFNEDQPTLTHVKILTSTSTWKIGTRISLYKVTR